MSLVKSGFIVAFFTLLSRASGLIRELIIAQIFGVSSNSDSLNIAFKFPNLFRRIFGEGALSNVFIPMFNAKSIESTKNAKSFTGQVFTILLLTLVILTILMQLFMPALMVIIAPGFYRDKEKFEYTVYLCRITMPYLIFISITAFFGGILNSVRKFAAFAFAPIILNIVIIISGIANYKLDHGLVISSSLIIAGILQVIFMFFTLIKAGLYFPLFLKPKDKDIKTFLNNMLPATLSAGSMQLNLFISQILASFIPGAISILAYADRIYQFPLSIIGISFATILLPELSKIYKLQDLEQAYNLQNKAIKLACLLSFPAMLGIITLAKPIIHIIYEHGAFSEIDTINTANTIAMFALGLPAFILIKILNPVFYANSDTHTPFKLSIYSMIINTVLNIILMQFLGYIGIALGSSIAAWLTILITYLYIIKTSNFRIRSDFLVFIIKLCSSCIIMSLGIIIIKNYYGEPYYQHSLLLKVILLSVIIFIAIIIFSGVAFILGLHKSFFRYKKYHINL